MKQVRPMPIGVEWNKRALKRTFKNPFDVVFSGSAAFKAAGSELRSRTLNRTQAKFRSA